MFTSNVNYGKRDGPGRELDGSHCAPPARGPYSNSDNAPPPEDTLLRKSPTHVHDALRVSLPSYEVDADPDLQRRVRFRPRKAVVEDQGSLMSSADDRASILQGGCKESSFWTPPESILTPPELRKKAGDHDQSTTTTTLRQAGPNQLLLQLRAALNEKELQLVELREQHIVALNRAADARHTSEAALQSKDRVIEQLQRTLKHHKSQVDRQERESQENLHALRKRQKQENAEVEKKELKVALLEAKNAQFVQELVEQQKIITRMKRHRDEKEKSCANHQKLEIMNKRIQDLKSALHMREEEVTTQANNCNELKTLLWKRDSIIAQLQLSEQQLQSSLARKEAAQEAQAVSQENVQVIENTAPHEKSLSERTMLRGNKVSQHQHVSERGNKVSHEDHLEREHHHQCEIGKLMELKDNFSNVHKGVVKDSNDKEGVMHRIQKRMRELLRSLRSKDMALSDKINEYQEAVTEIQRLKEECEELNMRNYQLESTVAHLQHPDRQMGANLVSEAPTTPRVQVLPYDFSCGGSTGEDLGFDNAVQDSMMEWEQFSNASVYHANFEKIKMTEVEMPDIEQQQQGITRIQPPHPSFHFPLPVIPPPPSPHVGPQLESKESPSGRPLNEDVRLGLPSEFEENYKSIQDEIKKREQCWRKTEEHMREALTQQMKLLGESKSRGRHAKTPKAHSTLNHLHHLQAAARGHKHSDNNRTPRRSHASGKYGHEKSPHDHPEVVGHHHRHDHESGGHYHGRHRRAAYEQELLDYELVGHCGLNHNVGKVGAQRRHHEHHDMLTDVERKYGGEQMQDANLDYRRRGRVA